MSIRACSDPPFAVTADQPAIGWLPPTIDATCCWIDVDVDVDDHVQVSAMLPTGRGPRPVATRSARPYQVWASAIQQVLVTGNGTVHGARWLPADVDSDQLIKLTALPVARPHPRYAALDNGVLLAAARVARGAPIRRALYDVDGTPRPFQADLLTVAAEVGRVGVLSDALRDDLLRLVDEEVLDPSTLDTGATLFDEHGTELGTTTNRCVDAVLQGSVDHGLARWLGFLDNDALALTDNDITGRIVTTVFAPDWLALLASGMLASIPLDAVVADLDALRAIYPDFDALDDLEGTVDGPFLDLGVMAACTTGLPLDAPPPPSIVSVTDRPTRTADVTVAVPTVSAWVPRTPPDAARATRLVVGDLVAGAALALARNDDPDGAGVARVLNEPSDAATFHRPLVGGITADAADEAGRGTLSERACPAAAVRYAVAQVDWFGRWSEWVDVDLAAGVRPGPPVPVVRASVTPAVATAPFDGEPLAGVIAATIPVPAPTDLAPGANLLSLLRFQVTDAGGVTTTTNLAIDDPAAPPSELAVTVDAPPLRRGRSTTVLVSAHWVDTAGNRSAPSDDRTLTVWDPRPPATVIVDPTLRYTARPDVAGLARVELSWPAASPQDRFRVYYADETTLRARLDGVPGTSGLFAALDDAIGPVERGAAWTDHAAVLPRDAFTLVTPQPLERTGPEMRLEHALPGSLRTLALYRIVAVSSANVDAAFTESPVVPVAVPSTLAPPQPHLAVRVLDPSTTGAPVATGELTVTVPRGSRRAVEYRLRRSRVSSADPLLMPIVATGTLHPPDDSAAPHVEVLLDAGPTTLEPAGVLAAWTTYTWRVEVRGGPEPGGGPPAEWSQPSQAVGASVVPLDGPPSPAIGRMRRVGNAVRIAVEVPTELRGGSLGSYRVELYRRLPGEREQLAITMGEQQRPAGDAPWPLVDDTSDSSPPAGTTYRAVIVDPRGRRSLPSTARTL